MRILVVSDSHGDFFNLKKAILSQPEAEVVIHLGDGEDEFDDAKNYFKNKMFIGVKGNCDMASMKDSKKILTLGGKKIFMTHGHLYNVKFTLENILSAAELCQADILLYGHTHTAYTDYCNGIHIMNPGSLHGHFGSYGYIDITESGIVTNIVTLN